RDRRSSSRSVPAARATKPRTSAPSDPDHRSQLDGDTRPRSGVAVGASGSDPVNADTTPTDRHLTPAGGGVPVGRTASVAPMAQDDTPTSEQPATGDAPDSELARLRAENERLQQELEATGSAGAVAGPRHRGRWFASWVLIVVGSLLVPVSVTSLWLNRTITDTDRYVETVAPLIRDQDIQRAIEARLEKVLYAQVDIQAEVANVLPERAAPPAAPFTGGLKNLISEVIHRVVTSDKVAELWDRANRIAQEQVEQVLTVSNGRKGVVSVDLTDTLKEVQKQLTDAGVPFVGNIAVPKVDLDVMQSDTIAQVQTAFGIFDRLAAILPWLTLLI